MSSYNFFFIQFQHACTTSQPFYLHDKGYLDNCMLYTAVTTPVKDLYIWLTQIVEMIEGRETPS